MRNATEEENKVVNDKLSVFDYKLISDFNINFKCAAPDVVFRLVGSSLSDEKYLITGKILASKQGKAYSLNLYGKSVDELLGRWERFQNLKVFI